MNVTDPVPSGQELKVQGKKIRTVEELLDRVEEISTSSFEKQQAEMAEWLEKKVKQKKLANKVEAAASKKETIAILRHVVRRYYEDKAETYEEEDEDWVVTTEFGDFITMEFIYGAIFGFILAMIISGIVNSVG